MWDKVLETIKQDMTALIDENQADIFTAFGRVEPGKALNIGLDVKLVRGIPGIGTSCTISFVKDRVNSSLKNYIDTQEGE